MQFCRAQNRAKQEEVATRERRAQARAVLTPQPTGGSETNLIDARLQRLKLEGTPRPKRERRQPAPPLSPIPITTDFSDFIIPNMETSDGDVDYGTLAQRMMKDIFATSSQDEPDGFDHVRGNGMGRNALEEEREQEERQEQDEGTRSEDDRGLMVEGESEGSSSPMMGEVEMLSGSPSSHEGGEDDEEEDLLKGRER